MKFLIAFISLALVFVFASADWETSKKRLQEAHKKCNEDPATTIPEDVIEKLERGEKPEPSEKLGAHTLCLSKELGWQKADGTINRDLVKERITSHVTDAAKQQEFLEKCSVEKENAVATALHLFRCIATARKENVVS